MIEIVFRASVLVSLLFCLGLAQFSETVSAQEPSEQSCPETLIKKRKGKKAAPALHPAQIFVNLMDRLARDAVQRKRNPDVPWRQHIADFEAFKNSFRPSMRASVYEALRRLYTSDHEIMVVLYANKNHEIVELADITDESRSNKNSVDLDQRKLDEANELHLQNGHLGIFAYLHTHPFMSIEESYPAGDPSGLPTVKTSEVYASTQKRPYALNDPSYGDIEYFIQQWNAGNVTFTMIANPNLDGELNLRLMLPLAIMDIQPLSFGARDPSVGRSLLMTRGQVKYSTFRNQVAYFRNFLSVCSFQVKRDPTVRSMYYLEVPLKITSVIEL